MMHWVSGGLSAEQQLQQATQANAQLREAYRAQSNVAFDAQERLRKLREALDALIKSTDLNDTGRMVYVDELQAVLDEHA